MPLVGRWIVPNPATPGLDFAGRIVSPASGSPFKHGQLVFGVTGSRPMAGGGLAEFALTEKDHVVALPDGVDPADAATIPVAGLTAYQTIVPHVKRGDRIFINGGSGGTGVFGIQIAKAVGCHVTTSCSTSNVKLCESLGADEVVDYQQQIVVEALKASRHQFDHIIDNVGGDLSLYFHCHEYTKPEAKFIMVGGKLSMGMVLNPIKRMVWGKRNYSWFLAKVKLEDLVQIATWMKEGIVKPVIDHRFPFEKAPSALERLKTGRAKGKIVVDIATDTYEKVSS